LASPTPYNTSCPIFKFAYEQYKLNSKLSSVDYDEFMEDYIRFWYIIKILVIYRNSGDLNIRLLFNHLITATNVFGLSSNQILLKLVLDKGDYEIIVYTMSLLHFIGFIPDDKILCILSEDILLDVPISEEFLNDIKIKLDEAGKE